MVTVEWKCFRNTARTITITACDSCINIFETLCCGAYEVLKMKKQYFGGLEQMFGKLIQSIF